MDAILVKGYLKMPQRADQISVDVEEWMQNRPQNIQIIILSNNDLEFLICQFEVHTSIYIQK
ncbi:unnamed protein product [Paramecium primaurelia]|uniref:Uncharacterized protein n=1 Tax=Paramecium primaurelia TaxID=5886 RepID=A0A8S1QQ08_PARPR|nr:unnamed protein product [Paramecium primaurelia]